MAATFRIEAFKLHDHAPTLAPSAPNRTWMDAFPDRHAYRCLPLAIANSHGWDVLCPTVIEIEWNGGPRIEDLTFRAVEPMPGSWPLEYFVRSNFSHGIVTLHTDYLFRTPPGWNLMALGPSNEPKTGIYPLTGVIESDWLPYPFTMNWQMLHPGSVRFERDEPFCRIMPVPKNYLEDWEVAIHRMDDDPVLVAEHKAFREDREDFMKLIHARDQAALKQAWQKHYFVGRYPDGTRVEDHVSRLRLSEPIDLSGTPPLHARK